MVIPGDAAIAADVVAVMADRNIPGAQVAIVMPVGAIWERSFGVRDLATSEPMTANPTNRVDIDGVMQPYGIAQLYVALSDPAVKLVQPGRTCSNGGYALLGHIILQCHVTAIAAHGINKRLRPVTLVDVLARAVLCAGAQSLCELGLSKDLAHRMALAVRATEI